MLTTPVYLIRSNVQDQTIHYLWDDWQDIPELEVRDEGLITILKSISQRAVLAFSCGTVEWILHRLGNLFSETSPWDYVEAAWAMVVHRRYSGYGTDNWQYYSQQHWELGPVKGPIRDALRDLEISFEQLASEYHADPSTLSMTLSNLAQYVITEPSAYRTWSASVLGRLQQLYPRNPTDPLGDVVPRQALDPPSDFRPEQTEALVNQFLSGLNPASNIFLSPPDAMIEHIEGEEDFIGEPYRFSMSADRIARGAIGPEEH